MNETLRPASKRQKLDQSSETQSPAAFWDNLSKIWLTKRALRELDRRNSQLIASPICSPLPQFIRPITRNIAQLNLSTAEHVFCSEPDILSDIKLVARHGGPDLSDLRSYPEPVTYFDHKMTSSESNPCCQRHVYTATSCTEPTANTTKTKKTDFYDRNFQQHLIDHGVYSDRYSHPYGRELPEPMNRKDIHQILAQPRRSLSPSKFTIDNYKELRYKDGQATNDKEAFDSVIPIIEGNIDRKGGVPLENLDPLTDGTLKPANPDFYYGSRPQQLSQKVRHELNGHIIPSNQADLPIAPNFFLAVRSMEGALAVADRQACYNGALGARAMHALRSYGQETPVYNNNADTITSIYHGGRLEMYTSHISPPRNSRGRPEYYMTQLKFSLLCAGLEDCRSGIMAYRNARDWTERRRNEAIIQANERANSVEVEAPGNDANPSPAPSFVTALSEAEAYTMSQESRTSLNEDSNAFGDLTESGSSKGNLAHCKLPAKRPTRYSTRLQTQRKRRNAGEPGDTSAE